MAAVDLEALLAACADEPIHVPEAVQPFGVAVVVDGDGLVTVRSSDPAGLLAGRAGLGSPLAEALGGSVVAAVLSGARLAAPTSPDGRPLDLVAHALGSTGTLVELEPADEEVLVADELIERERPLWQARTLSDLLASLVVQVRALTGFDRVMVYRFDGDWNGEVVAEALAGGLDPYLGLRYPASDIPAQARALYRRNPSRLIADVGYQPSPLVHADPGRTAPLDLSDSGLRSVSPVHLQYLRNMGVAASMSLSLMVDGELWGLVACHHESGPRRPDPSRRRAATALAELASSLLVTVSEAEVLAGRVEAAEKVGALRAALDGPNDPLDALVDAGADLLGLVDAAGAVVNLGGRLARVGAAPSLAAARADVVALLDRDPGGTAPVPVGAAEELPQRHGDMVGAMAVAFGSGWVVWYRPELVQEVHWAGDPRGDEVATGADGRPVLGPRRSFATFVESVEGRCRAWGSAERWAAGELGAQMGAALERRSRDRLRATQLVQQALLVDTTIEASGFTVAVRYQPADDDPVGGDWHDVFHLPDGTVAFVVGDAVGHGIEVAGTMAQLRNALRAYVVASAGPDEAINSVDRLVHQLLPGQLATVLVCLVDPGSGRFRLATAGHPPPILLGAGAVRTLEPPRGPLLGLGVARRPGSLEGVLAPGEGMVLYTDGLVERRDVRVPEALDRLCGVLAEAIGAPDPIRSGPSVADLCDLALGAGTRSDDDDVTVLAFRRADVGKE